MTTVSFATSAMSCWADITSDEEDEASLVAH